MQTLRSINPRSVIVEAVLHSDTMLTFVCHTIGSGCDVLLLQMDATGQGSQRHSQPDGRASVTICPWKPRKLHGRMAPSNKYRDCAFCELRRATREEDLVLGC